MTTIQFYHLTATPLERALPKILEKALAAGFKTLLVAESEERTEQLNQLLWTYDPGSFLPHGSVKDGNIEQQPILICSSAESPEILCSRLRASQDGKILLAVTNGAMPEQPEAFARILDIFDGNDAQTVEKARNRWKLYKDSGYSISYLRQNGSGSWEQKAVA